MLEHETNQSVDNSGSIIETIISGLFGVVSVVTVLVCLTGMIYCCFSFNRTIEKFSNEDSAILRQISIYASSESRDGKSSDTSSSISPSSGMTSDGLSDKKDEMDRLLKHMESLVAIQKNGMTNDLMSFIYGILSSLLVGLCAGFLLKSRTNADAAKKTANEAKKNADNAKAQAEKAAKKARGTEEAIAIAKKTSYQLRLVIISSRIVFAKSALAKLDYIYANNIISQIREEIKELFSDNAIFISLPFSDGGDIGKVYGELLDLHNAVDYFWARCQEGNTDEDKLMSNKCAADNYHEWIDIATGCIDNAIIEMHKTKS